MRRGSSHEPAPVPGDEAAVDEVPGESGPGRGDANVAV